MAIAGAVTAALGVVIVMFASPIRRSMLTAQDQWTPNLVRALGALMVLMGVIIFVGGRG